jgi:RsmE family RNA methyltransferase
VNLILLTSGDVGSDGRARIGGDRARHIREVLKSRPGHEIRIGVIDGPTGTATVLDVTAEQATLSCDLTGAVPPVPSIDLLLALPRPKVLRRLWAQLAALGVGRIILTNAEKVERDYFDTHYLQPETYAPLLIEGLQQARDTRLPRVTIHRRFRPLIEDELPALSDASERLVAEPGAPAMHERPAPHGRTLLAVGPEGGWNRFELDLLGAHGFTPVGMGDRTLRADTAVISLLAIAHSRCPSPGSLG